MKEKSFEGVAEAEVQKPAEDWIKTQPGIRITNTRITTLAAGPTRPGEPIRSPDGWTIIVEYEGLKLGHYRLDARARRGAASEPALCNALEPDPPRILADLSCPDSGLALCRECEEIRPGRRHE